MKYPAGPAEFVLYNTATCGPMRARVVKRHRDKTLSVEPWFWQRGGKDCGCFQGGHLVRIDRSNVVPADPGKGVPPPDFVATAVRLSRTLQAMGQGPRLLAALKALRACEAVADLPAVVAEADAAIAAAGG